jgi:acyl-CoA synthetase (AMP-forming)/AMP-acid ligase II
MPKIPLSTFFRGATNSLALVFKGQNVSYQQLSRAVGQGWGVLKPLNLAGHRVAMLCNKLDYAPTLFSIWSADAVAVPLCSVHSSKEMQYYIENSKASTLIYSPEYRSIVDGLAIDCIISTDEFAKSNQLSLENNCKDLVQHALIIYTSGSTGNPKGVVHSYGSLLSQMKSLQEMWAYSENDRLLHVLPLHHIHGIVNGLLTCLYTGSTVEFVDKFNAEEIWQLLARKDYPISLFFGVPTIYTKLLKQSRNEEYDVSHLRLCVSGSAALPSPIKRGWEQSTGHVLLERYGMSEIGMALSCGLEISKRIDSSVGWPMPNVQVKLATFDDNSTIPVFGDYGEILVQSGGMFIEYYGKPEETEKEFVIDAQGQRWFRTGDIASQSSQHNGAFFIHGRNSVDIIKSGGYKISALEIERELLGFEFIIECAVVGLADEEWGQKIAAVVVSSRPADLNEIRHCLRGVLAPYKLPKALRLVESIPRNAMGKVNKKDLAVLFL